MSVRLAYPALIGVLLSPSVAMAHLVVTGMGPVYDGVIHFGLSPEDSLPVVGLGLWLGLRGPAAGRLALAALPVGWVLGGLAVSLTGLGLPAPLLSGLSALGFAAIGLLLAADVDPGLFICLAVAFGLGLVRGGSDVMGGPTGPAQGATVPLVALIGMAASAFTLFALAASVTLAARRGWMIIAARVAGSWLAAAGILLAGWVLRFGAGV